MQISEPILRGKKHPAADDGGSPAAPDRKRTRSINLGAKRSTAKVSLFKQQPTKNSAYNFSSTFRRELITHAEKRNILPEQQLIQPTKIMHALRKSDRIPASHGHKTKEKPPVEAESYQDSNLGWGKFRTENSSISTILDGNSSALLSQNTKMMKGKSTTPAERQELLRTTTSSNSHSKTRRNHQEIAETAPTVEFQNPRKNTDDASNDDVPRKQKSSEDIKEPQILSEDESESPEHIANNRDSYPVTAAKSSAGPMATRN